MPGPLRGGIPALVLPSLSHLPKNSWDEKCSSAGAWKPSASVPGQRSLAGQALAHSAAAPVYLQRSWGGEGLYLGHRVLAVELEGTLETIEADVLILQEEEQEGSRRSRATSGRLCGRPSAAPSPSTPTPVLSVRMSAHRAMSPPAPAWHSPHLYGRLGCGALGHHAPSPRPPGSRIPTSPVSSSTRRILRGSVQSTRVDGLTAASGNRLQRRHSKTVGSVLLCQSPLSLVSCRYSWATVV
uniref:Uncharacterized protein LOC110192942 n=1 Tax=Phascolarctos cinereus TaxID=38626 RepID=A0A6P5IN44_PHACI|nr:uncharacterized protein LOC110192942 [Phascolarctos cinereus]